MVADTYCRGGNDGQLVAAGAGKHRGPAEKTEAVVAEDAGRLVEETGDETWWRCWDT